MAKWNLRVAVQQARAASVQTVATMFAVIAACWAAVVALHALRADTIPFITVTILGDAPTWKRGRYQNELHFAVVNAGKGPARITGICRHWEVLPQFNYPTPLSASNRDHWKAISVPVAGGGKSSPMDAWWKRLGKVPKVPKDHWLFFHGYVEFQDVTGIRYVAGFCEMFRSDRPDLGFHTALPSKNAEAYNYQRNI